MSGMKPMGIAKRKRYFGRHKRGKRKRSLIEKIIRRGNYEGKGRRTFVKEGIALNGMKPMEISKRMGETFWET